MISWIFIWIITTLTSTVVMRWVGIGLHKWRPQMFAVMTWKYCLIFSAIFQFVLHLF